MIHTSVTREHLQRVTSELSSTAVIRLITEIADTGPIPPRGLARTFPDITPHQIRHATEQAHAFGLVRAESGLRLTEAGADLAEIYDATARWARRHQYPARSSDFTTRIQRTFALLAAPFMVGALTADPLRVEDEVMQASSLPTPEAAAELVRLWKLLTQWLLVNPRATNPDEGESAA